MNLLGKLKAYYLDNINSIITTNHGVPGIQNILTDIKQHMRDNIEGFVGPDFFCLFVVNNIVQANGLTKFNIKHLCVKEARRPYNHVLIAYDNDSYETRVMGDFDEDVAKDIVEQMEIVNLELEHGYEQALKYLNESGLHHLTKFVFYNIITRLCKGEYNIEQVFAKEINKLEKSLQVDKLFYNLVAKQPDMPVEFVGIRYRNQAGVTKLITVKEKGRYVVRGELPQDVQNVLNTIVNMFGEDKDE